MKRFPRLRLILMTGMILLSGAMTLPKAAGQFSIPDPRNSVQALALGPAGTLYMGTFGKGIFKSVDGGVHWEAMEEGLGDPYIMTLRVKPPTGKPAGDSEGVIFAGTARKGVYRSRDGGRTWEKVNAGLKNTEVTAFVLGSKNRLYAATGRGVFMSTDEGDHWVPHNTDLDDVLVRSLIIDRRGTLFAGTGGKGLFRRKAGQPAWERLTRGFEAERGLRENFIRVLTLGQTGIIYAGTFDGGIFTSQDGGRSWNDLSQGLTNQSIRAILLDENGVAFAGTGKGIFMRSPVESEWRSISGDLEDLNIQSMVMDREGRIYAGTGMGLYQGSAGGHWTLLTRRVLGVPPGKEGL